MASSAVALTDEQMADLEKSSKPGAGPLTDDQMSKLESQSKDIKSHFASFTLPGAKNKVTLDPEFGEKIWRANADMVAATGQPIIIGSSFRTKEKQQQLYDELKPKGARVATPGHSLHEKGLAADISNWRQAQPYLKKYGLENPFGNDRGHFQTAAKKQPLPNLAELEGVASGDEGKQAAIGLGEGVAKMGGKYASMVDPRMSYAFGGMEVPPDIDKMTRPQQAKGIEQDLAGVLGVKDAAPPEGLTSTLFRGLGKSVPAVAEAAAAGKGVGTVAELLSSLKGVQTGAQAVKELSPLAAKAAPYAAPMAKTGATFGAIGATEPEPQTTAGIASGAALGGLSKFGPLVRGAGGAGLFAGQEKLMNPNAKPEDIVAQGILGGAFGLAGGEGKGIKKPAVMDKYLQNQFSRSLSPKVEGKRDFTKIDDWHKSAQNAAKEIVWSGREGKLALGDPEKPSSIPQNALEFSQAIEDTKWRLVKENRDDLNRVGKDVTISEKPFVDALAARVKELDRLSSPGMEQAAGYARDFIERIQNRVKKYGPYTIEDLQSEIAELNNNQNMKAYFANSNPDTGRNVKTDAIFADVARKELYKTVEAQKGDKTFRDRRMLMRDIMRIEPEVAKRAVVNMRKPEKGFYDVADPLIAMHLAHSVATGNILGVATTGAGIVAKVRNKLSTDRDRIIKNTFKTLDKNLGDRPQPPPPMPGPQKLLPPGPSDKRFTMTDPKYNPASLDLAAQLQMPKLLPYTGQGTSLAEHAPPGQAGIQQGPLVAKQPNVAIQPTEARGIPPQARNIIERAKDAAEKRTANLERVRKERLATAGMLEKASTGVERGQERAATTLRLIKAEKRAQVQRTNKPTGEQGVEAGKQRAEKIKKAIKPRWKEIGGEYDE